MFTQLVFFSMITGLILGTCGCIEKTQLNVTSQPTISPTVDTLSPPPPQTHITASSIQNTTEIPSPISTIPTVTPRFTGTISYNSNKLTYGSNQSPPLTEELAWKYAEDYLANFERINGLSVLWNNSYKVVTSRGQGKHTYENNTQTWTWSYNIYRCRDKSVCYDAPCLYPEDCYVLEAITVDANDGHIIGVWFPD
jgi:hypothetical protein